MPLALLLAGLDIGRNTLFNQVRKILAVDEESRLAGGMIEIIESARRTPVRRE
jgi:hypothetical protein